MKVQRVYIDTSVIGGCFDEEFAPWSNGLMKDFRLGTFRPVVSDIVAAEVRPAPERVRQKYAQLEQWGPEFVRLTEEVRVLASAYMKREIVPPKYSNDSLHIALATVAEVDILTSWNFKHIVHFEKIRRFNAVNREQGYKPIEIYSPREVTSYGSEEDV
ncbi:MAG: PIN domain-containing protein [Bacteroidetes bacterium]|jgi:predicted nucleic acid-binding protein|nr:PIN domain-containing protein [Bacteroidota bacterium]